MSGPRDGEVAPPLVIELRRRTLRRLVDETGFEQLPQEPVQGGDTKFHCLIGARRDVFPDRVAMPIACGQAGKNQEGAG